MIFHVTLRDAETNQTHEITVETSTGTKAASQAITELGGGKNLRIAEIMPDQQAAIRSGLFSTFE